MSNFIDLSYTQLTNSPQPHTPSSYKKWDFSDWESCSIVEYKAMKSQSFWVLILLLLLDSCTTLVKNIGEILTFNLAKKARESIIGNAFFFPFWSVRTHTIIIVSLVASLYFDKGSHSVLIISFPITYIGPTQDSECHFGLVELISLSWVCLTL